jgi:hypothetical protein
MAISFSRVDRRSPGLKVKTENGEHGYLEYMDFNSGMRR